jgi:putative flippase GtrA
MIQFARFFAVGAIATGCQYMILLWLVRSFQFDAAVASCTGFIASACLNYALNYSITFKSSRAHRQAFSAFAAIAGVGLLLNAGIMTLLTLHANIHYLAAQVCATVSILLWSFFANRTWTFGSARTP